MSNNANNNNNWTVTAGQSFVTDPYGGNSFTIVGGGGGSGFTTGRVDGLMWWDDAAGCLKVQVNGQEMQVASVPREPYHEIAQGADYYITEHLGRITWRKVDV